LFSESSVWDLLDIQSWGTCPHRRVNGGRRARGLWLEGLGAYASPEVVWHTVHRQRQSDPDLAYSKVLERTDETRSVLEQKFVFLPVVGTAVCKMVHVEVPLKRIDYKLVESDHFRAMEGSWILTPHHSGKSTYLQLSSHLKLSFIVPQLILEKITARKLHKRLANVKAMAEGMQASIAERPAQTSAAAKSLPGL